MDGTPTPQALLAVADFTASGLGIGDQAIWNVTFDGIDCVNGTKYLESFNSGNIGVTYMCFAYQQPMNADGSSIFKGATIPVKVRICDYFGAPITDANICVNYRMLSPVVVGDYSEATSTSAASTGCTMRYDATADQ